MLPRFRNAAGAVRAQAAQVLFLDVDGAQISANLQRCSRRLHAESRPRCFTPSRLLKILRGCCPEHVATARYSLQARHPRQQFVNGCLAKVSVFVHPLLVSPSLSVWKALVADVVKATGAAICLSTAWRLVRPQSREPG